MHNLPKVNFNNDDLNIPMKYVVIVSKYENKWLLVRHKDRNTFEVPGGHIENGEDYISAAKRELYEETGAEDFEIYFVSPYYVEVNSYTDGGYLFFADIKSLSPLPDYEIEEINLFEIFPNNLTYPHIQPILFNRVQMWLNYNEVSL